VTIIPEIDTPGHSLVISKWKPELMIQGNPDHLNLTHPDTTPTIKAIWDEVLPWIDAPEVSIGADEYDPSLANDYISFVNEMAGYISAKSGKSIRVWGTNEPSETMSISTDVTIQHWDFPGDSIPVQLMEKGYRVINSEQAFLYLDGKTSDNNQFPQELDASLLWNGAPANSPGQQKGWAPNIFSSTDPSNNTSPDNPNLRGSIMALWNDWGNNATTKLEIYYQLAKSIAFFAEKTWAGSEMRESGLSLADFDDIYEVLNDMAPGQNLNRAVDVPSNGTVFEYGAVETPIKTVFESVGPPYTLSFSIRPEAGNPSVLVFPGGPLPIEIFPDPTALFAGTDAILHLLSSNADSTFGLAFEDPSTHITYFPSPPLSLPAGATTKVEIHATREWTYAVLNGSTGTGTQHFFVTNLDIWGEYMKGANMSFAAPSSIIGGFGGVVGELQDVLLRLSA
jgi:hexosaminidase